MNTTPRNSRIPSLDGVRALAFGLVFVSHAGLERWVPGGFGVMVFFVLSGYLITTLLRAEYRRSGTLDFGNFYLRRVLRILPPLYVTLVFLLVLHMVVGYTVPLTWRGVLYPSLFLGNYFLHFDNPIGSPTGYGVVWSLAIEEHYYLFFPPLALWILRSGSRRRAQWVLGGLCLAVLALRLILFFWFGVSEEYLYHATESRCDGLLMGSLLGLAWNPWLDPPPSERRRYDGILLTAALLVLAASFLYREPWFRATLRYSVQGVALLPIFWLAVVRWRWWPMRWLNYRLLVQIGDLSYTLYLVHFGIIAAFVRLQPGMPLLLLQPLALALSIGFAMAMRRWVERPMRSLGRRASADSGLTPDRKAVARI